MNGNVVAEVLCSSEYLKILYFLQFLLNTWAQWRPFYHSDNRLRNSTNTTYIFLFSILTWMPFLAMMPVLIFFQSKINFVKRVTIPSSGMIDLNKLLTNKVQESLNIIFTTDNHTTILLQHINKSLLTNNQKQVQKWPVSRDFMRTSMSSAKSIGRADHFHLLGCNITCLYLVKPLSSTDMTSQTVYGMRGPSLWRNWRGWRLGHMAHQDIAAL